MICPGRGRRESTGTESVLLLMRGLESSDMRAGRLRSPPEKRIDVWRLNIFQELCWGSDGSGEMNKPGLSVTGEMISIRR